MNESNKRFTTEVFSNKDSAERAYQYANLNIGYLGGSFSPIIKIE